MISSNPVSRHILGSVIDDKDILIFFLFRFRVLTAGLVDVDRAVIDIARNERPQSFHNRKTPM